MWTKLVTNGFIRGFGAKVLFRVFFAIILVITVAPKAQAAPSCSELFLGKGQGLKISAEIPPAQRAVINGAFNKVRRLTDHLINLPGLDVVLTERTELEGGAAALPEGRIELSKSVLALSDSKLEAILVHEFTHFSVARNLHIRPIGQPVAMTLHDYL